jgi:Tfp pilus assembly protein PilZ
MISVIIGIIGIILVGIASSLINVEKISEPQNSIPIDIQEKSPIIDTTQKSGPFVINKSQYKLGEKIFLRAIDLQNSDKGQAVFIRPINSTHSTPYQVIQFDGELKSSFNQYVEPKLLESRNTCDKDSLIGIWEIWFRGTNYQGIKFQVMDELTLDETGFDKPVC